MDFVSKKFKIILHVELNPQANYVRKEYFSYDIKGNTTHPGIKTAHTLQWVVTLSGKPANAKFYSYAETSSETPVWVWYDAQCREVRRDANGLNGNKMFVETGYNARGEVSYITEPYFQKYDLQGNSKKLTDPDAGVITSVYNRWGQLVHPTGDSIVTTSGYHASGLLQNRIRNGETTVYGYDGQNRLTSISIAGQHVQNFLYGPYDRLTQVTETVDSSKSFVSQTEYDLFGRVSKETYPV